MRHGAGAEVDGYMRDHRILAHGQIGRVITHMRRVRTREGFDDGRRGVISHEYLERIGDMGRLALDPALDLDDWIDAAFQREGQRFLG